MQEFSNLRRASLDPGQFLNHRLRLRCCAGRLPSEVCLDGLGVLVQLALRLVERDRLEALHTPGDVLLQVCPQSVLGEVNKPTDLAMGKVARFQPDRPHLLLHPGMRMMQPLVLDGSDGFGVE